MRAQDASELGLVGTCSGAWYAAKAARNIGAQSAILVNLMNWNWRFTPMLLSQWSLRKKALHANAASDTGGGPSESRTERLKALLKPAHEPTESFMHNHLPRYVLRVLSVGRTRVAAGGCSDNACPPWNRRDGDCLARG